MAKPKRGVRDPAIDDRNEQPTKGSQTLARILDAAAILLKQRGYAGTRLSDIAELASMQAPTLYYYFKSRDELIEQVVVIGQQRVFNHVSELLEQSEDLSPIERVRLAVRAQLEITLRDSNHASAAMRVSGELPPNIRQRQLVEQTKYGDLWRRLIADAAAAGQINPKLNTSSARMLVLGALNWVPEWWHPELGSLEEIIATAQTIVLSGLQAPDSSGPVKPKRSRTSQPSTQRRVSPRGPRPVA